MRTRGRNKPRHMCTEISAQIRCVRHAARQVSKRQREKINLKQGMRWRWHRDASEGQKGYLRRSDRDVHSDLALIAPQVPIQSPPSRYQPWPFRERGRSPKCIRVCIDVVASLVFTIPVKLGQRHAHPPAYFTTWCYCI